MSQTSSQARIRIAVDDETSVSLEVKAPLDDVYGALANERRRAVLRAIAQTSVPMDLETLSREIATRERPEDSEPVSTERLQEVHVSLYHNHLPRLADLGLVTLDAEEMTVDGVADTVRRATA